MDLTATGRENLTLQGRLFRIPLAELRTRVDELTILPMTFLSSMIMSRNLMPGWIKAASRFNPVNWAVTAARDGFEGRSPGELAVCLALLAGFAAVCGILSTLAFRIYRRAL